MTPWVALGILAAFLAVAFVAYPLFIAPRSGARRLSGVDDLRERRRVLYRQIVEIEFDERLGKLDRADAQALSEHLLSQAAVLLAEETSAEPDLDAQVEREIRTVREALAAARQPDLGTVAS